LLIAHFLTFLHQWFPIMYTTLYLRCFNFFQIKIYSLGTQKP